MNEKRPKPNVVAEVELSTIADVVRERVENPEVSKIVARYRRYLPLFDTLMDQPVFDIEAVKEAHSDERPAFITTLVNQLAKQGWLNRDEDTKGQFLWNRAKGLFSRERWLDEKLFGTQIKNSPAQERPRERLLAHGVSQLRTSELLAILIRVGIPGESAVMAGEKLAQRYSKRLDRLPLAGRVELKSISGAINATSWCQIMAGIELGRRVEEAVGASVPEKIGGSNDAIDFCMRHFRRLANDAQHEEFHIVTLDTKNKVTDTHLITKGTLDASLVHPREVFAAAIRDSASSIILVHNHPSGDPTPSREDRQVTDRLTKCGELMGIDVLDHIVIGRQGGVSIRSQG